MFESIINNVSPQLKSRVANIASTIGLSKSQYFNFDWKAHDRLKNDEFLERLCVANAGFPDFGNYVAFEYALQNMPPRLPILEIGSFLGLSINVLNYLKRKHRISNPLFSCDRWTLGGNVNLHDHIGESLITWEQYRRYCKECFMHNVQLFSSESLPFTIELLSHEFFSYLRTGKPMTDVFGRTICPEPPFGFCFIDGAHDYENAKADFLACDNFLCSGGYILFDDAVSKKFDVYRVVKEVLHLGTYKLIMKGPNPLFMKI